jgi:hypothetical protein
MNNINSLYDVSVRPHQIRNGIGTQNGIALTHGGPEAVQHGVQNRHGTLSTWLRNRFGLNTHLTGRSSVPPSGRKIASSNFLPTEIVSTIFEAVIDGADAPTAVKLLHQLRLINKHADGVSREIFTSKRHPAVTRQREMTASRKDFAALSQRSGMSKTGFAAEVTKLVEHHRHLDIKLADFKSPAKRRIILAILSKSTHLRTLHLDVGDSSVDSNAVITAAKAIGTTNPELSEFHLDMRGLSMKDDGAQSLATNPSITSLNVSNNKIGVPGVQALAGSPSITSLNVSGNTFGDAGAQALAANPRIIELDASFTGITIPGAQALALSPSITSLKLDFNHVGSAGAIALAQNPRIVALDLSYCGIDLAGVYALANNRSITKLGLRSNRSGDAGARALANSFSLIELDVSHNTITKLGAKALANSRSITKLDMRHNRIGYSGAKALIKNMRFIQLDLRYNSINIFAKRALKSLNSAIGNLHI